MQHSFDTIRDRLIEAIQGLDGQSIARLANQEFGMNIQYSEDGSFKDIEFENVNDVIEWLGTINLTLGESAGHLCIVTSDNSLVSPEFNDRDELIRWANENRQLLEEYMKLPPGATEGEEFIRKLLGYKRN